MSSIAGVPSQPDEGLAERLATPCSGGNDFSTLPAVNADYLQPQYWNERFEKEESFEWFKGYGEFRHLVIPHLLPQHRILVLGCGNSSLSADLWGDGFKHVTSVDLSPVVIQHMRERSQAAGMPELQWQVADMLALPFDDASFDVVIEKGTLDVLFVDQRDPWDPAPAVRERVFTMLDETHRVLSTGGQFISITFAQPHFRKPFLTARHYSWSVQHESFGEASSFSYFVYRMIKGARGLDEEPVPFHQDRLEVPVGKGDTEHTHMDDENYLMGIEL